VPHRPVAERLRHVGLRSPGELTTFAERVSRSAAPSGNAWTDVDNLDGRAVRSNAGFRSCRTGTVNLAKQLHAVRTVIPTARGRVRKGQLTCMHGGPQTHNGQPHLHRAAGLPPRHLPNGHSHRTAADAPPGREQAPARLPRRRAMPVLPGQWWHDDILAFTVLPWNSEWLAHSNSGSSPDVGPEEGTPTMHPQRPGTHKPADRASPYARRPSSETPAEAAS
jgi:hypothetical protein